MKRLILKRDFYECYNEMYDLVMEPSGNYRTFSNNFSDIDTEIVEAYNLLEDIVGAERKETIIDEGGLNYVIEP